MACKTSYELHHQFPRLAEESGFTFNTHRPRVHIDWNKIKLIDIESLIRDRKFTLIEHHLNDILDCVFESEFDIRILDEGVMKMFRLAQLALEYQQFCRHYLDRSVFVLREEITSIAHELDITKNQLQEKEEELRKLRKRSRHSYKSPLPYGNDNIAALILKTLSNKGDVFPSTSNADVHQFNKCTYCEKVFMNQLYLQSHIARRHADAMETPQKDRSPEPNHENAKLSAEIMELKSKLKAMEVVIENTKVANNTAPTPEPVAPSKTSVVNVIEKKNTKDAEVSTNNEEYLLNKIEEWKSQENERYSKEITALKAQIMETINSMKEQQTAAPKDSNVIEQLQSTIIQQGAEITALKNELHNSKISKEKENINKNKETEAQILFWSQRVEAQTKQHDALLQKLNEVAKDAKESRDLAKAERERAAQLQILLQESLNKKAATVETSTDDLRVVGPGRIQENNDHHKVKVDSQPKMEKKLTNKTKHLADRQTFEHLHRKAQELLNVASITSSSTESSSPVFTKNIKTVTKRVKKHKDVSNNSKKTAKNEMIAKEKQAAANKNDILNKVTKTDVEERKEPAKHSMKAQKDVAHVMSGSPMRIVRAKITEEVNNRIVSIGVDPLKSRLPQSVFQQQKIELQRLHEIKSKKNPMYEKVKYSIITSLDSNTEVNKHNTKNYEYASPNKVTSSFRNISSVISNVKAKAMSLVKLNETSNRDKRKFTNGDIAKRVMSRLRTPAGSANESPARSEETHDVKVMTNNEHQKSKADTLKDKHVPNVKTRKEIVSNVSSSESEETSQEVQNFKIPIKESNQLNKQSIENLIKSPVRRPCSADIKTRASTQKFNADNGDLFTRTQSAMNLTETKVEVANTLKPDSEHRYNSSDDVESLPDTPTPRKDKQLTESNQTLKQTKSVLKHASSTSSLNKKKVLFDMDAIQMKSVSASPSQSITEKSDNGNEQFELGLVNIEGEEWDISSIENEPLKNDTKIQVNARTSPKIAELKHVIESQLARRSDITSTAIVGGVDILAGPAAKLASIGGSNTSLGSSILDDSEGIDNRKAFVKPRKVTEKEDSELDISEFSMEGLTSNRKIINDF